MWGRFVYEAGSSGMRTVVEEGTVCMIWAVVLWGCGGTRVVSIETAVGCVRVWWSEGAVE